MRKSEFRAWDIDAKKMRYLITKVGWSLHGITSCAYLDDRLCDVPMYNLEGTIGERDHFVLMERTGLNDKAGTPIWEGDIVSFTKNEENRRMEVHYNEQWGIYEPISWEKNRGCPIEVEIVGNIYENSEILEEKG